MSLQRQQRMEQRTRMDETVATIRKSRDAEIRITLSSWKGRPVIDCRVWCRPKGGGDYIPSRKGFACDLGKLPELAVALRAALLAAGPVEDNSDAQNPS
jgi:hypothetical protein